MKKKVVIVSEAHSQECRCILTALGRHESASRHWVSCLDREIRSAADRDWFLSQGWDGVIHNHPGRDLPRLCRELGIACVDLDDNAPAIPGVPKIKRDNRAVGRLAAERFVEMGRRSFAFYGYADCAVSRARREGFAEALACAGRAGTSAPFCLASESSSASPNFGYTSEREFERVSAWLKSLPPDTAVFACDDVLGAVILDAGARGGPICPGEIAVLGAGNEPVICDLAKPALSSIDLNGTARGKLAAETLQRLMDDPSATFAPAISVPPHEIVTRQSTDSAAVPDAILAGALAFIRERARHGLRVEDLARQSRTSRRILERRFQKHLGKSPNAAIREALVSKIKLLLTSSDKPLSEIAYDTGFAHPEYMNVVFKKSTGTTPGAYRQVHSPRD